MIRCSCTCHGENVYAVRRKIMKNGPVIFQLIYHHFIGGSEFEEDENKMLSGSWTLAIFSYLYSFLINFGHILLLEGYCRSQTDSETAIF